MKPHAKIIIQQLFKHQTDYAAALNVDKSTVWRWLHDKMLMSVEHAQKTIEIAARRGITLTLDELLLK